MQLDLNKLQEKSDPFAIFARWYEDAAKEGLHLPEAMSLATVNSRGCPSVRIVLLKSFDANGFVFFTNYESDKGRHLAARPMAASVFHWSKLHRQVRLEGTAEKISEDESDAYFSSRPRESQIGAWASQQSRVIENREILEMSFAKVAKRWPDKITLPRPPTWGGYRLQPLRIEFWQGGAHRLHDRIVFHRNGLQDGWRIDRLAP